APLKTGYVAGGSQDRASYVIRRSYPLRRRSLGSAQGVCPKLLTTALSAPVPMMMPPKRWMVGISPRADQRPSAVLFLSAGGSSPYAIRTQLTTTRPWTTNG